MKNYPLALILAIGFDLVSVLNLTLLGLVPELLLTIAGIAAVQYFTSVQLNPVAGWRSAAMFGVRLVELVPFLDLLPWFTVSVLLQWLLGW